MEFESDTDYRVIYWSGQINDVRLRFDTFKENVKIPIINLHSAIVLTRNRKRLYCCVDNDNFQVSNNY